MSLDVLFAPVCLCALQLATDVHQWNSDQTLGPFRGIAGRAEPRLRTDTPPEIVQQPKPSRKVLERLEKIQSLPRREQDAILTTIDHFLNSAAAS